MGKDKSYWPGFSRLADLNTRDDETNAQISTLNRAINSMREIGMRSGKGIIIDPIAAFKINEPCVVKQDNSGELSLVLDITEKPI